VVLSGEHEPPAERPEDEAAECITRESADFFVDMLERVLSN
jgi:hypothetical protein